MFIGRRRIMPPTTVLIPYHDVSSHMVSRKYIVYHYEERLRRNGGLVEKTGSQDAGSHEDRRGVDRQKVGVLGAGTMGSGIAITVARVGHPVVIRDVSEDRVEVGLASVRKFLDRGVERGRMSEEQRDTAVSGMSGTTELEALADCDVVIEAIFEDEALKAETFGKLDSICSPETIFHTNTSTLSVTAIAAGSAHPERVVGTHYAKPAPMVDLVEVVKARQTAEQAYQRTMAFVQGLGKVAVTAGDTPG